MADRFKTSAPIISSENGGINYDGVSTDGTGNGNLTVAGTLTQTGAATLAGRVNLNGAIVALSESSVATPTGAAQTIATSKLISRTAPSGACTNAILAAGTVDGQIVIVTNENVASTANTITFNATIATSFVANDGTNPQVVKCGTAKMFVWLASLNSGSGAWVALEPFAG